MKLNFQKNLEFSEMEVKEAGSVVRYICNTLIAIVCIIAGAILLS